MPCQCQMDRQRQCQRRRGVGLLLPGSARTHTHRPGAQFESRLMAELCALWGVRKNHTTPYHSQANGVVKRGNRDFGDILHSMLLGKDEEDWDLLLPQIMRTIRASLHKRMG